MICTNKNWISSPNPALHDEPDILADSSYHQQTRICQVMEMEMVMEMVMEMEMVPSTDLMVQSVHGTSLHFQEGVVSAKDDEEPLIPLLQTDETDKSNADGLWQRDTLMGVPTTESLMIV